MFFLLNYHNNLKAVIKNTAATDHTKPTLFLFIGGKKNHSMTWDQLLPSF